MSYSTREFRTDQSFSRRLGREVAPWAAILSLAVIVPRLLWAQYLDPFQDGYQNWWIARHLVETGTYWDPFSGMTQGNWLPGYHGFLALMTLPLGSHIMPTFKLVNILFSLATTGVLYLLARPRGREVALLAALVFALNPADIVISTFATPEALTLFSVFAGVLVMERRPWNDRTSLVLGSGLFLLAATLRYEAWGFILLYLAWTWWRKLIPARTVVAVGLPAVTFMVGWLVWTLQFGVLPQTIVAQTSVDLLYKDSIGALASAPERLWGFSLWYLGWTPFAVLALAWALMRERGSPFTAILLFFYGALIGYTLLNFGNPSARYVHLTIPIVSLFSATAVIAVRDWVRRKPLRHAKTISFAPVVAVVAVSALLTIMVVFPNPAPGTFTRPMERAGHYLRDLPLPEGKLLVSESPIAAYLSGYPASRIVGSTQLPDDAVLAEAYLVEHVAYVVMVTVPYYRLRTLFPEQADGVNSEHLRLLFDASGSEYYLGGHRVLVFEVVS